MARVTPTTPRKTCLVVRIDITHEHQLPEATTHALALEAIRTTFGLHPGQSQPSLTNDTDEQGEAFVTKVSVVLP